ncbi:MAG TPA: hypothetical protein VHZ32_04010 [Rhizomicrobium sp.]|nr:hypothetical protein [Rhizomicrobium sp.]
MIQCRQLEIDAQAGPGEQQIVEHTGAKGKNQQESGAQQHRRQPRIRTHALVEKTTGQEQKRRKAGAQIGGAIQPEMAQNHPKAVNAHNQYGEHQEQGQKTRTQSCTSKRGSHPFLGPPVLRLLLRRRT